MLSAFVLLVDSSRLIGLEPQLFGQQSNFGATNSTGVDLWNNPWSQAIPHFSPTSFPTNSFDNNGMSGINAQRRDLRLGTEVSYTNYGATVVSVERNSPAERAEIARGDVIVNVGGYQVGWVGSRLFDLGDEVQKRVEPDLTLNVLVFSRGQLASRTVDMRTSGPTGLFGQVSLRDRQSVPNGSILIIRLQNRTRPFYEVNGGQQSMQVYGGGPFPYQINYDPRYIDQSDQYEILAYIYLNGQAIYSTSTPILVDMRAPNRQLDVVLDRPVVVTAGAQSPTQVYYPPSAQAITELYNRILRKTPNALEMQTWTQYLGTGRPLAELEASLYASPVFFERAGNSPRNFVSSLFTLAVNRPPSGQELQEWESLLTRYGNERLPFVTEFLRRFGRTL